MFIMTLSVRETATGPIVRRYRTRQFKTLVNALCRLGDMQTSGEMDKLISGTDRLLVIIKDSAGNTHYRHLY